MNQPASASSAARRSANLSRILSFDLLRNERAQPWLVLFLLVVLVGLIYAPTINLAFYEEDPSDFDESRGRPLGEIFAISTSELYYRPVHLAYFQLMSVPFDFDPRGAHWMRLGMHVAGGYCSICCSNGCFSLIVIDNGRDCSPSSCSRCQFDPGSRYGVANNIVELACHRQSTGSVKG